MPNTIFVLNRLQKTGLKTGDMFLCEVKDSKDYLIYIFASVENNGSGNLYNLISLVDGTRYFQQNHSYDNFPDLKDYPGLKFMGRNLKIEISE